MAEPESQVQTEAKLHTSAVMD